MPKATAEKSISRNPDIVIPKAVLRNCLFTKLHPVPQLFLHSAINKLHLPVMKVNNRIKH